MFFECAREFINRQKKLLIIYTITSILFMAYIAFLSPAFAGSFNIKLLVFLILILITLPAIIIGFAIKISNLNQMSLTIEDEFMFRLNANKKEIISFTDIKRVVSIEDKKGIPKVIKIGTAESIFHLVGFRSMETIMELISSHVSVDVLRKPQRINFDDPRIFYPFLGVFFMILGSIFYLKINIQTALIHTIGLFWGVFILTYRPFSKAQGKFKRRFENIMGGIIVLSILFSIVVLVFG